MRAAALSFVASSSDRVEVPSGLDDLTAFSIGALLYPTSLPSSARVFQKGSDIKFASIGASNAVQFTVARATANAVATSTANALAVNLEQFALFTYDETDGPRIFVGTRLSPLTEVTYASGPTVGTGASAADSAGVWCLGNRTAPATSNRGFGGQIAVIGLIPRRLELAEGREWQRTLRASGDASFDYILGANGRGPVLDRSGNGRHATITGAVPVSDRARMVA